MNGDANITAIRVAKELGLYYLLEPSQSIHAIFIRCSSIYLYINSGK